MLPELHLREEEKKKSKNVISEKQKAQEISTNSEKNIVYFYKKHK